VSTPPTPYVLFPGNAREALEFYRDVFGGELTVYTRAQFGRTDEPVDAVAHGMLTGDVALFGADRDGAKTTSADRDGAEKTSADETSAEPGTPEASVRRDGLMLSLLGTSTDATLRGWFERLAEGGRVIDDLQERPWGAWDGQVVDRYGLHWLIGFEGGTAG
jgi:PhnB protein